MRHKKHKHRIGTSSSHRKAMLKSLFQALIKHGEIETTITKAKALKPYAEKLISKAVYINISDDESQQIHLFRQINATMQINSSIDKELIWKLIHEIAPFYILSSGGYISIVRTRIRKGDASQMARVKLIHKQKKDKYDN